MRIISTWGAFFALGFAGLHCQGTVTNYPPAAGCPVASHACSPGGGNEIGAGGSSTISTGTGGSIDQPGTVGTVTLPSFAGGTLVQFSGAATIVALPSVGGMFTASYPTPLLGAGGSLGAGGGAATSDTFELMNIPAGPAWLLVQDLTNGASGIYSTYSPATLPVLPSITLPVVQQQVLMNVASDLPSVQAHGGVSTLAAQVVLVLTLNGAPYAGVSVTAGAGGAEIAYDIGMGTYSDTAMTTGSGGTIILFNAGLSGPQTISLLNAATMTAYAVPVQTGPGVVTLVNADFTQ